VVLTRAGILLSVALAVDVGPARGVDECPGDQSEPCPTEISCGGTQCACFGATLCSCAACVNGQCVPVPKNCDDEDPCTIDSCSNDGGCKHSPFCDDGDPCTDQACTRVPIHGFPDIAVCGDPVPACDDGKFCNGLESCFTVGLSGPVCVPGAPPDCDDHDLCTADGCRDELNRCDHVPFPCDDGNDCTADVCEPAQGCTHPPIPGCCHRASDCAADDPCTVAACDPTGRCTATPIDGFDALACVCRRSPPAACTAASLPGRLLRKSAKACALVSQGASRTGVAQTRAVAKAAHLWQQLERFTNHTKIRSRLGACAEALGSAYHDALGRAGQVAPAINTGTRSRHA
jgi:hypothetical protein